MSRPAPVLRETRAAWPGLELVVSHDDIRRPAEWRIEHPRHVVIVHLGGRMDDLRTELAGHPGSRGPASPGELWTVPAGRAYRSRASGGTIRYAVLYLAPDALGPARPLAARAGVADPFAADAASRLASLAGQPDDLAGLAADALGRALLAHLFRAHSPARPDPPAAGPRLGPAAVRRLRDHVHDRLGGRVSVADLAAAAGLTPHQLHAAFRAAFGTTPAQYVLAERVRLARRLLLASDADITAVALAAGFASHSHLCRAFARRVGCGPREFRRRAGG